MACIWAYLRVLLQMYPSVPYLGNGRTDSALKFCVWLDTN